ncbi:ABC-2 type transport system permease protein [Herbihabitans rhizosphaerae]|uniref:Transport permease protein n=1 Tax=Herbihabitans rhizosphaerae TaxID=1872711 RepID=A0A4Q7KVX7_9PSEU|nr:ABC transporter permease [Herbihabitans rhizosphaerae]RZS40825.1 ABC-2 type transport system permease protein [Herbihabitans rhizosphaerae]
MWRDTWLIFKRDMTSARRNMAWIGIGIMQPLLYMFLFGPLLEPVIKHTPGFPPGDAWTVLTPALIIQLGLFSSSFAGFGLLADYRSGVVERMRVTPASRMALLLGKVLTNAVMMLFQAVLIIVLALVVFDLDAPLGGVLLSLLIAGLLAIALASMSFGLALRIKSEEAFPAILQAVLIPVLLLSGIIMPITTGLAPDWLYAVSRINPFTHVVDANRAVFRGDFAMDALFTGSVVLLVMAVLAVWWGARTFQRENA